jgi:hypothetical protein
MIAKLYGRFPAKLANGEIDWDTHTIKVALCTSAYTPDQDFHEYFDDITNQITGTGYTTGGATITGKSVTYDLIEKRTSFSGDSVVWSASTLTARYAIIYRDTGITSTSPLISYVDFGTNAISSGGDFTIDWDIAGIVTVTVS